MLVTCGRSTSCSAFSFQIPVNADTNADGVVAAAAAIVVDDALYIYCQHLVCFFSCRYARASGLAGGGSWLKRIVMLSMLVGMNSKALHD